MYIEIDIIVAFVGCPGLYPLVLIGCILWEKVTERVAS